MSLTEIIFWLFARLRPLLWYYHRLGHLLSLAIRCFEDDAVCLWLNEHPKDRARVEGIIVDAERLLEAAIALRVRELLGLPIPISDRIGLKGAHRIHTPTSLARLAGRLDRLVERYDAIERLARRRAAKLKRAAEAAPVRLEADHRPENGPVPVLTSSPVFALSCAVALPAGLRIRAPP